MKESIVTQELQLVKSDTPPTPKIIAKLKMVESHKLTTIILASFTEKKMTYNEFAEWASKELGFTVTGAQVASRVKEFEVPHGERPPAPDPSEYTAMLLAHEQKIEALTERVNQMEVWINQHFPTVSGKLAIRK